MAINLEKNTRKSTLKSLFDIFVDQEHCSTLNEFIHTLAIIEDVVIVDIEDDKTILNNKKDIYFKFQIEDWQGALTVQVNTKDNNTVLGFTLADLIEGTAITYAM